MFPLAFVAGSLQGHWWGFISRNYVVWPIFSLMNVFIALKGTQFLNFIIWANSKTGMMSLTYSGSAMVCVSNVGNSTSNHSRYMKFSERIKVVIGCRVNLIIVYENALSIYLLSLNFRGGHQTGFGMQVQKGISWIKELNSQEKVYKWKGGVSINKR